MRTEHRLMAFENRVLRIFGPRRDNVRGKRVRAQKEGFMICTPHPKKKKIIRVIKSRRMR
jgi:hypothetical protein